MVVCEGVVAFFSCNSLNARNHVGAGVPVTVDQALILSSKPAFSAAPTASSCAGRHVRVSLVLDAAVGLDASLFRGDVSESTENGAPARAARNVRRRGTRAAPRLSARGRGAAGFVIGLVTVRVVAVPSHVLLRLDVASERVESEVFPTP